MPGKTRNIRLLLAVPFIVTIACGVCSARTVYVDAAAVGANDGSSWADAYVYLEDALADANMIEKPVEIRVAQGRYTPDRGAGITPGDRGAAFKLLNGVTIQGGFAGVVWADPDARAVDVFETNLTGDLAGDDAEIDSREDISGEPTRAENSGTVVRGDGTDETAVLDGVTITAGGTDMDVRQGSPTVLNCTFKDARRGVSGRESQLKLSDCTFRRISWWAIDLHRGDAVVTDCLFTENWGDSINRRFYSG